MNRYSYFFNVYGQRSHCFRLCSLFLIERHSRQILIFCISIYIYTYIPMGLFVVDCCVSRRSVIKSRTIFSKGCDENTPTLPWVIDKTKIHHVLVTQQMFKLRQVVATETLPLMWLATPWKTLSWSETQDYRNWIGNDWMIRWLVMTIVDWSSPESTIVSVKSVIGK